MKRTNRNYAKEQQQYVLSVKRALQASPDFEVQSSGGKLTWHFMHNNDGELLVQAPMRIRWTKVLNSNATLMAIARGKDRFVMIVEPLAETESDYAVEEKLLMVRIDQLCIA